ncbi:MAG: hypothetical protein IJ022_00725 [Burkholderiaceae bacterium]|nr:hypothetical protein [Burkholderiaceae bacterium]
MIIIQLVIPMSLVNSLAVMLRPKRIRYWDSIPAQSLGSLKMNIQKLSDIPADRPVTESLLTKNLFVILFSKNFTKIFNKT